MDHYPLSLDDAHLVVAGLQTLSEEMRSSPSDDDGATELLLEGAARLDALAARIDSWLMDTLGPLPEGPSGL